MVHAQASLIRTRPWTPVVRAGYRVAYAAARLWWAVRRPRTSGALVAVWHDQQILLLRTSYRPLITLPGGFVGPREAVAAAAARELREEVGLQVRPADLVPAWHGTLHFESRLDAVTIFELRLTARPPVRADSGEVRWVGWLTLADARAQPLLPHVRQYLDRCFANPG